MTYLEFCYSLDFSKQVLFPREIELVQQNYQIIGAPKSGKTSLIWHYLGTKTFGTYLYVDLNDLRLDESINDLDSFIQSNKIEILVLENLTLSFVLPKVKQIIISNTTALNITGFEIVECLPLCFEEFLLFDKKHQNITASFNYFLKYGNLPKTPAVQDFYKISHLQNLLNIMANDTNELIYLKKIFMTMGQTRSVYQLYTNLKKEMKISKDRFYAFFNHLIQSKIIYLIPKYNQPKINSKIMLYNHAFFDAVSVKKNFQNSFENMVFLELLTLKTEIFYLDGAHFFLPNKRQIILAIPFWSQSSLGKNFAKLLDAMENYAIDEIKIITVATNQKVFIGHLEATIEPFYEWALAK